MGENELWIVFVALFVALMLYDLVFVERRKHEMTTRIALRDVIIYVAVGSSFGLPIALFLGTASSAEYFAAYVIEFAMSVDNLFVFILLFAAFGIEGKNQHRVLFYGILGAIFFRALFVVVGIEMLNLFNWMMLIFGAILIYAAYNTAFGKEDKPPEESLPYRLASRLDIYQGESNGRFFVRIDGKLMATIMFACLVVIELSDIMFAFDSIPAALSITRDVFIVFTSNIFAVLGLRSLYFVLKDSLNRLRYLKYGLGVILGFIGAKMFLSYFEIEIPVLISLAFIIVVLLITVVVSNMVSGRRAEGSD